MPQKCKTSHVAPVLAQNACDSTREEEIIVRFTIAISVVQIVQVTKLIYSGQIISRKVKAIINPKQGMPMVEKNILFFEEDIWKKYFLMIQVRNFTRNLYMHVCMILGQKNCPNRESKSVLIRVCKNRVKNDRKKFKIPVLLSCERVNFA